MKGFTKEQIISAVVGAQQEAVTAARDMYARVGERDACGFGWVDIYVERTNSREAKALMEAGFRKSYRPKTLTLWDPAGLPTQSISVKEAGAEAFARYFRSIFPEAKIYSGSRMD
jgi:hypothetical protein